MFSAAFSMGLDWVLQIIRRVTSGIVLDWRTNPLIIVSMAPIPTRLYSCCIARSSHSVVG